MQELMLSKNVRVEVAGDGCLILEDIYKGMRE